MIYTQNDCVGCDHCENCGLKHAVHMVCDKCKDSFDELYEYGDEQLCESCLLEEVPKIDVEKYKEQEEGEWDL